MRHILVVNNGSLLEEGIVRLLTSQEGLDVLSLDFEDEEALIRDIDSLHPDVIVVNREASVNLPHLIGLLASVPGFSRLQILIVSANSNMIGVYEDQQVYELHSQDFFDFLQSTPIK